MVTETKERIFFNSHVKSVNYHYEQLRTWIPCRRCIDGNMYYEGNGEYVCVQCGWSYDPKSLSKRQT